MTLTGVDAASHRGAISAKGKRQKTIAVFGTGVDVFYPQESSRLADRFWLQGGALISEFPAGKVRWRRKIFPSATASSVECRSGVLVVESRGIHRYAYYRWLRAGTEAGRFRRAGQRHERGFPGSRTHGSNRAPSWLRPGRRWGADLARELRRALTPLDCLNPQKLPPHLYAQTKVRSSSV
jgi:hypothetical protein